MTERLSIIIYIKSIINHLLSKKDSSESLLITSSNVSGQKKKKSLKVDFPS